MTEKDYYKILGVDTGADSKQIKEAFRQLALKYHPDRNRNNPEAAEKMKWINEAYAVLANPDKRNEYDNIRRQFGPSAYGRFRQTYTEQDILTWERETEKFVVEGSRIFHDAELIGGTVGVSCDMCHPDASNTHPETYPKFQVQLGKTALLRDMINWCIEQPVRGKPLDADDPRMRALEAYIIAQRKGVALDYNKH